jgi:queuine tRNA-ribosyltransferase
MPVGTYGTVKAMTPEDLENIGAQIILGNTFHLYLRPGLEVIEAHDGLHRFMHWDRPILTDSGGFQVFSLKEMRKITEEGARFRSPIDGVPVFLSPEESMRIQRALKSDVAMSFDECTPYPASEAEARESMELSMRWALRGFRKYHESEPPGTLFGIVQGGVHDNLRAASLAALEDVGFAGLAIGGLAVGESVTERERVLDGLVPHMRCIRKIPIPSRPNAAATRAATTAAATCVISTNAARSWGRTSTPSTTYIFING